MQVIDGFPIIEDKENNLSVALYKGTYLTNGALYIGGIVVKGDFPGEPYCDVTINLESSWQLRKNCAAIDLIIENDWFGKELLKEFATSKSRMQQNYGNYAVWEFDEEILEKMPSINNQPDFDDKMRALIEKLNPELTKGQKMEGI